MEWLQSLLDSSTTPILTAFLLGLLTAISPCPLATNITAVGFLSKDIGNRHRVFIGGLLYTVGRIITYTTLGFILIPILQKGTSVFAIQKAISMYGEKILPPLLLLMGLFMLFGDRLNLSGFGFKGSIQDDNIKKRGYLGALLLGILFSLAFCPTSGVFYFGMLIPMAALEPMGYWYPPIFAIATALPVIAAAWIIAYSVTEIGKFYDRMQTFRKWLNIIIALLFISAGTYYAILFYL